MPQRPHDNQLTNIIDKLAKFVAKNGQEFEQMTKIKQQDNPQFSFLHPNNEYFNYYQFKVMEERRNLSGKKSDVVVNRLMNCEFTVMPQQPLNNFQQQQQQHIWSSNGAVPQQNQPPPPINFTAQIESVNTQQMKLRDQIMQSEKNLQAQHQVILGILHISTHESL